MEQPEPVKPTLAEFPVPPLPVGYASCDRCNAPAYVRVVVDAVKQLWLDFCVHDFKRHEAHVMLRGYAFEDKSFLVPGRESN